MTRRVPVVIVMLLLVQACERERREYRTWPPSAPDADSVRLTSLEAGLPREGPATMGPYDEQAYGISEGKRLYSQFNCVGCHAHGGGGIGPALMDEKWIYGAAPEQIYSTIVQGRPNGMPSFGAKIPPPQIWQIVAYVRSMSAATPRDAKSGRADDLSARPPELRLPVLAPRQTGHR
jgi:cytochrome c oxidase cbb3-type subunit 3